MTMKIEQHFIYFKADQKTALSLGASWVESKKCWRIPNNIRASKELYDSFSFKDIAYKFELEKQAGGKNIQRRNLLELKSLDDCEGDQRLRPYQRTDVNYLKKIPNALIGNEMRTGKSPTALTLFEEEGRKKNCIVCPAKVVNQWVKEVTVWTDKTPFPVKGTKKQRLKIYEAFKNAEEGYLIISRDTLRGDIGVVEAL
jgi:SNF2 family DNA or RNA helicase